ncbi:hypothetical protein E5Z02_16790 [Streptomyces rhizosphaericola]|uniref:Coenzyme Q-binding protein COQ10 START domain-containing protein n=1 Tax=Streptomyces rhizosphaericola TaxID=2564098 RepID=A0ABY2PE06_9ACTN|nr:hypothetical protein E5Z02_16790 [Streptomyces rhizosphaericola]
MRLRSHCWPPASQGGSQSVLECRILHVASEADRRGAARADPLDRPAQRTGRHVPGGAGARVRHHRRRRRVWEAVNKVESWPQIFSDYDSVEVLERSSDVVRYQMTTRPEGKDGYFT